MATIKSETWDSVTAPALPSGWTVDSAPVTATTNSPSSAPNSLVHPAASANASNVPHATWATADGVGGNVRVWATVRHANTSGAGTQQVWVFARGSVVAANSNWGTLSYYYAGIIRNGSGPGFFLHRRVSGSDTQLGLVGATAFADATNYRISLKCQGSTISAQCQRLSDSFWLNSSGTFVSDPAGTTVAISVTDTAIAPASGYSGVAFYLANTAGGDVGADDWLLETASATYYVAPSGSDSNAGTSSAAPWQTIAKVNAQTFGPGDQILFQGGATFSGTLVIQNSGSASSPLLVGSYGSGQATISPGNGTGVQVKDADYVRVSNLIITGSGVTFNSGTNTISTTSTGAGVEVISTQTQASVSTWRQSVYLDRLTISGCYAGINYHSYGGAASPGPYPVGYNDVRITNCTVHHTSWLGGIVVWSNNATTGPTLGLQAGQQLYHKNVYVAGCTVHDCYGDNAVTNSWSGSGIVVANVQTGTCERCLVYNCGGASGSVSSGGPVGNWAYAADSYTIQYCEVYTQHDPRANDGGGFDLDGGCTNCAIQYCYSHDNDGPGYQVGTYTGSGATSSGVLRYNVSQNDGRVHGSAAYRTFGTPSAISVHNNTWYAGTAGAGIAALIHQLDSAGPNFYNNIFWCGSGVALLSQVTTGTFAGNLYWFGGGAFSVVYNGVSYSSLAAFQAGGQESVGGVPRGLFADPRLFAPGTGGALLPSAPPCMLGAYVLLGGSPAIDAALELRTLFGLDPGLLDYCGHPNRAGAGSDIGACEYAAAALSSGGLRRVSLSGGIGG